MVNTIKKCQVLAAAVKAAAATWWNMEVFFGIETWRFNHEDFDIWIPWHIGIELFITRTELGYLNGQLVQFVDG